MAFSTQKEFFQVPFMNETIEFECRKECVKLKTYQSTIDDRSWALNANVQSNYFKDLVSCRIPKKVLEDNDSEISDEDELNDVDSDALEVKKGPADQKKKDRRAERNKNVPKRQGKDKDEYGDEYRRKQAHKDGNAPNDDQSSDKKLGQRKNNDNGEVGSDRGRRGDGKSGAGSSDHTEDDNSPGPSRNKYRNVKGSSSDEGLWGDSRMRNDKGGRKKRDVNENSSENALDTSKGKPGPLDRKGRENDEHLSDSHDTVGVSSGAKRGKNDSFDKSGNKRRNVNGSSSDNDKGVGGGAGKGENDSSFRRGKNETLDKSEMQNKKVNGSSSDDATGVGFGDISTRGDNKFAKDGRKKGDGNLSASDVDKGVGSGSSRGKSHPLDNSGSKSRYVYGSGSDDTISAGSATDSRRGDRFDKYGRKMGDVNESGSENGKTADRGRNETNGGSGSNSKDRGETRNQADGIKTGFGDKGRGLGTGVRENLLTVENLRGRVYNHSAADRQRPHDESSSSFEQKLGPSGNKMGAVVSNGIARDYFPDETYIGTINASDPYNDTKHLNGKVSQGFRVSIPGEMGLQSDESLIHVANTAMARLQDMLLHQNNLEQLLGDANKQLNDTTMELRSRLKGFKEMEWKIDELQRKAANAGRDSDVLRGSLSEQTRYIQDMEHEFIKTEDYYEQKLKNIEQDKQEAQRMVCCLKFELQKQRREAALVSPLKKQNLEMSHEINRLKCALQEYDVMYQQLVKKVEVFKNHGYSFDGKNSECDYMCSVAACDALSCSDSSEF